mgnify:CR=1 FL=1
MQAAREQVLRQAASHLRIRPQVVAARQLRRLLQQLVRARLDRLESALVQFNLKLKAKIARFPSAAQPIPSAAPQFSDMI